MLYNKPVPISEAALLVIDAQNSFTLGPLWARRNNRFFERNVGRLIQLFRQHDLPVIYFLHSDEDPGFERESPYYRLMDFIAPWRTEPVLHKTTRNVFTSTELPALLLEKGVRRVVITGIQMEQCCETSARVAADLGYAVDFVTEATMTFPIPNHDSPGEELDVEAIRERTEYALRRRFATIATVGSIELELAGLAGAALNGKSALTATAL
jgi:nicotinamidase-related amidase